jgi:hypothetical protein
VTDYTITVGDRFGTSTSTYVAVDPGTIDPTERFVADGLQAGWELPGEWPAQPGPVEVRFALVGPDVDPLLDIGSVCSVVVEAATGLVLEFYGRVTDMTASPIAYEAGGVAVDGQRCEVIAVDYSADLAEIRFDNANAHTSNAINPDFFLSDFPMGSAWVPGEDVPPFAYPPQFPTGFPDGMPYTPPGVVLDTADPSYLLRGWGDTEDPGSVRDLVLDILRQTPRLDPDGVSRGGVRYMGMLGVNVDPATAPLLDDTHPFTVDFPPNRSVDVATEGAAAFPLEFTDGPDGWGLHDVAPGAAGWVLDAARVDYGATKWTRNKWGSPNRVRLIYAALGGTSDGVYEMDSVDRDPSDPVSVREVQVKNLDDAGPFFAGRLAPVYLPETDPRRDRWEADEFTYYADDTLARLTPSWFPRPTASTTGEDRQSHLTRPVVVHSIVPGSTPLRRGWYAGQLRSVLVTFVEGTAEVRFSLRRSWAFPASGDPALTPADVGALPGGGPTVADLDPSFTVYDYRLAQGT